MGSDCGILDCCAIQKDRDARRTVEFPKAEPAVDGAKRVDISVPAFGYKNRIGVDPAHGAIRKRTATDAAHHNGAHLSDLIDKGNAASDVWADTAYRSVKNEEHPARNGLGSQNHRKKPNGKPMPKAVTTANGKKSKVRNSVERVFARQKGTMAFAIRTIGLAGARVKIGVANLTDNMKRII